MHFHDTGEDVAVAVFGKPFYSLQCREGLESELGQETVMMGTISGERLASVPYTPVMGIADVLCIAVFIISA